RRGHRDLRQRNDAGYADAARCRELQVTSTRVQAMKPFFLVPLGAALVLQSAGCATVKPYERARLAHPTMLLGDMARTGASHVYSIQEGATGGRTGAQRGCGCN